MAGRPGRRLDCRAGNCHGRPPAPVASPGSAGPPTNQRPE
jgi:hypothetical protein